MLCNRRNDDGLKLFWVVVEDLDELLNPCGGHKAEMSVLEELEFAEHTKGITGINIFQATQLG